MDLSTQDALSSSAATANTLACIDAATGADLGSAFLSGYTCINVDDAQYYYPNKLQVVLTLQWLTSNYEAAERWSLPRCSIYAHYTNFCKKHDFEPVNAASFGKVIRQVFPDLKTHRLGTRGQSKYHYYGIRVKESSAYYKELSATQRESAPMSPFKSPGGTFASLFRSPGGVYTMYDIDNPMSQQTQGTPLNQIPEDQVSQFLLPEFPDAEEIQLADSALVGKVDSFLDTYRTHCQKLLNTVLNSKLEEVHFHIERFWHELSVTSQQLLEVENVALTIAVCDKLLYQTIINILMPGIIQHLLPSLLHAIRHFSCTFMKHLQEALSHQPQILVAKKLGVAQDFANLLKRKTSLSHLAQAMCTVLRTDGSIKQMLHDWKKRTELSTVRSQLLWLVDDEDGPDQDVINKYLCEFVCLLDKRITVEDHLKWLESVRKRCMAKYDKLDAEEKSVQERRFMLQFCYLSNLIIRDQTLRSASSFGSFHLLHLMYEEYLLYVLDVNKIQQHEKTMWKQLCGPDSEVPDNFITSMGVASLDRKYGSIQQSMDYMATCYPTKTTKSPAARRPRIYSQPLYQTFNQASQVSPAHSSHHTNNNAQLPLTSDWPRSPFLHHTNPTLGSTTTPPSPILHTTALPSSTLSPGAGPGGFASGEFATLQYSPQLVPPGSLPNLIPSPGAYLPSSPVALPSSAPHYAPFSPCFTPSPLASSSPRQPPPAPPCTPQDSYEVSPVSIGNNRTPYGGFRSSAIKETSMKPLNLSNEHVPKTLTSTTNSTGNSKYIAIQLLKVSLVENPAQSDKENRGGRLNKNKITLSVPLTHGFSFSKGQMLKLSDGKAYNIDEVQTVLKENPDMSRSVTTTPAQIQQSTFISTVAK